MKNLLTLLASLAFLFSIQFAYGQIRNGEFEEDDPFGGKMPSLAGWDIMELTKPENDMGKEENPITGKIKDQKVDHYDYPEAVRDRSGRSTGMVRIGKNPASPHNFVYFGGIRQTFRCVGDAQDCLISFNSCFKPKNQDVAYLAVDYARRDEKKTKQLWKIPESQGFGESSILLERGCNDHITVYFYLMRPFIKDLKPSDEFESPDGPRVPGDGRDGGPIRSTLYLDKVSSRCPEGTIQTSLQPLNIPPDSMYLYIPFQSSSEAPKTGEIPDDPNGDLPETSTNGSSPSGSETTMTEQPECDCPPPTLIYILLGVITLAILSLFLGFLRISKRNSGSSKQ